MVIMMMTDPDLITEERNPGVKFLGKIVLYSEYFLVRSSYNLKFFWKGPLKIGKFLGKVLL